MLKYHMLLEDRFEPVHVNLVLDFCEAFRFDCDEKLCMASRFSAITIQKMDCARIVQEIGCTVRMHMDCAFILSLVLSTLKKLKSTRGTSASYIMLILSPTF